MRHEMLTQRALFCHHVNTKRGTLSQHFVTHVVPPLAWNKELMLQPCTYGAEGTDTVDSLGNNWNALLV